MPMLPPPMTNRKTGDFFIAFLVTFSSLFVLQWTTNQFSDLIEPGSQFGMIFFTSFLFSLVIFPIGFIPMMLVILMWRKLKKALKM